VCVLLNIRTCVCPYINHKLRFQLYIFASVCVHLLSSIYIFPTLHKHLYVSICISATVYVPLHVINIVCTSALQQMCVLFCILSNVFPAVYRHKSVFFLYQQMCLSFWISGITCIPLYISNCVCPSVYEQMSVSIFISGNVCLHLILANVCVPLYSNNSVCLLYISDCMSVCTKKTLWPAEYNQLSLPSVHYQMCVLLFVLAYVCAPLYNSNYVCPL